MPLLVDAEVKPFDAQHWIRVAATILYHCLGSKGSFGVIRWTTNYSSMEFTLAGRGTRMTVDPHLTIAATDYKFIFHNDLR